MSNCVRCHEVFEDNQRVIYSTRETFVWKPANVADTVNPASVNAEELRESRKDHLKTAVVNTFIDWGRSTIPSDAFYLRHQWCEPQRTGAGGSLHPIGKHWQRFKRSAVRGRHG